MKLVIAITNDDEMGITNASINSKYFKKVSLTAYTLMKQIVIEKG